MQSVSFSNQRLLALFFAAILPGISGSQVPNHPVPETFQAIVVEQPDKNGVAGKSGLQEGDILLNWSTNAARGTLASPLDLIIVEAEQGPRGPVTLEGLHGTQKKTWLLGDGAWGVQARPAFPENLSALYGEGMAQAKAGHWQQARGLWREMPGAIPPWLGAWLYLRAAETFAASRQWPEADEAFQAALQGETGDSVKAYILRTWGKTYELRSEWPHAEESYQKALESDAKVKPENLARALDLSSLGHVALARSELPKAESYFQQSLKIREALAPGTLAVAISLHDLGISAFYRSDLLKAQDYFKQGLEIRNKISPDSLGVADCFTGLGTVANYQGDQVKAQEYYHRALEIRDKLAPESIESAKDLLGLGNVTYELGDLAEAEKYYRRSYEIRQKIAPDSLDVAKSLMSLGNVIYDRGDLARANSYYNQAYEIRERIAPDSLDLARSLMARGIFARDHGDLADAEDYENRALEIQKRLSPGTLDVASTLNNLGIVFFDRGELAKAEDYYLQSLAIIQKKAPDSLNLAHRLTNLGRIALVSGDLDKAGSYFRGSLDIKKKQSPESLEVATGLNNLGEVAAHRQDWLNAEDFYQRALEIREKLAPHGFEIAWNLNCLGALARDRGQPEIAEKYYSRALEIWDRLSPDSSNQAEALAALGKIKNEQGKMAEAGQFFERAIHAVENQTTRVGGTQEIRAGFRSRFETYYKDDIDLLISQGRPELAFQILESSRARTLIETLLAGHVDIQKGVEPALLQQERSLLADINAKSDRLIRIVDEKNHDQRKAIENEIGKLQTQHQELQARIRANSPSYAALTQPQPLTVQDVQQRLLDADTTLLEYALGKDHSYVFCVTASEFAVRELPNRAEIESAARKIHGLLASHDKMISGETFQQRQERWGTAEAEYSRKAAALSAMVFDPIAPLLKRKRILVVAEGALQYISFAALPDPATLGAGATLQRPMILGHEMVNLPSISVLDILRSESRARQRASKTVAVLADPVFEKSDSRLALAQAQVRQTSDAEPANQERNDEEELLTRSATDMGLSKDGKSHFARLPFSRKEAEAILAVTPSGQGKELLDFSANRAAATSPSLGQYRIIHFATHGLLNSEHPELSGLVLSMVDPAGKPQNGFLQLQDIYNLNLPSDLVVLSACETALGKEISGEGLIGLTRGFMYAGASRVVASLWKVSDVATAQLMAEFYRAMEKDGMAPAAALRAAQIKMWKQRRWHNPYFWAAFQLQGEWN